MTNNANQRGFTIVIAGKGGTGKTLTSSLLVRDQLKHGAVLAIDADPDANLLADPVPEKLVGFSHIPGFTCPTCGAYPGWAACGSCSIKPLIEIPPRSRKWFKTSR
jgi:MinD superfamily P-loop ATPase